ncbi:hypothetical protein [Actinomycetospora atypica]|uniref:Uncharacterized protein n=1 Tax=Actinomycetospora atypica TaxID=1290095 RepID=A0ABV9YY24_9PSEU
MTLTPEERYKFDEIERDAAAAKVRWLLEHKIMPRVAGALDAAATGGRPVPACQHALTEAQMGRRGLTDDSANATPELAFDWLCEDQGLLCSACSRWHLAELNGPHAKDALSRCIVCGDWHDLRPWSPVVDVQEPVQVTGVGVALVGVVGVLPVVWECAAHDGFLDTTARMQWPRV